MGPPTPGPDGASSPRTKAAAGGGRERPFAGNDLAKKRILFRERRFGPVQRDPFLTGIGETCVPRGLRGAAPAEEVFRRNNKCSAGGSRIGNY